MIRISGKIEAKPLKHQAWNFTFAWKYFALWITKPLGSKKIRVYLRLLKQEGYFKVYGYRH